MSRALTIINVTEFSFFDLPGGVGRLVYDLCRKQVQWGHRAYLLTGKASPGLPDWEELEGIMVRRCIERHYPSPDPRNLISRVITTRREVARIMAAAGGADVIHSHSPMQGLGALGGPDKLEVLKVHSIHSPWLEEVRAGKLWERDKSWKNRLAAKTAMITARRVEAACFARSDYLTADSNFTRQEIAGNYKSIVRKKRFEVLPGWVDADRFRPQGTVTDWQPELGRRPAGPVFFTVRALVPRNGLDMLIEAAAMVKARGLDFDLAIAGSGPLREKIEQKIRGLSLADRVRMIGRVDDDRLPVLYRSCDAFVLPTIALECFGLIILEALASGKPVIATPVGAIPELLQPVYAEGLLRRVSAHDLADAMARLLKKIQGGFPRESDRARLRRYAAENYSVEAGTGRFREVYESSRKKPRAEKSV